MRAYFIFKNANTACILYRDVARILHWGPQKLSAEGARIEAPKEWMSPSPTDYSAWGVVSSPSGHQRIFGTFEAHRTLLVERTVLL